MFNNARLKLLMKLVGFERLGSEDALDTSWIVPSARTSSGLGETLSMVERFVQHPWASDDPNEAPEDLLRRVRHAAKDEDDDVRRDAFIDDSEGDDGLEDFMFPANIRSKSSAGRGLEELKKARRKRKDESEREPADDEVAEAGRKAKRAAALERRRKIKSELYIHDSDEEMNEEESRAFFAREEENRKRQAERIRRALALGISDSGAKGKKRKSVGDSNRLEKRRRRDDSEDDELLDSNEDDGLTDEESVSSQAHADPSNEDMEDTPLSSQSQGGADETSVREGPLKELRQPPAESGLVSKVSPESVAEDDDEAFVASSRRARYRAGFIVDSDDE
jgi:replication fork protection complex subunit Tof1/Swi1